MVCFADHHNEPVVVSITGTSASLWRWAGLGWAGLGSLAFMGLSSPSLGGSPPTRPERPTGLTTTPTAVRFA
jgi:hypothetical protein